jgi:hypothetical protein
MPTNTNKKTQTKNRHAALFEGVKTMEKGKRRPLKQEEVEQLLALLSAKECPEALSVDRLIPEGSLLERICRFFKSTDTSYALPLFQLIMIASSYLTQGGANLWIPGFGTKRPILWTIALAKSGSSKTLATDKVAEILLPHSQDVRMFPTGATDAQWIVDLAENNGSYWFQDEVGQLFQQVLKQSNYARIKPWMLDAYSHKSIGNRLKGEAEKLSIEDPHFTFLGLSVRETWTESVDAASMLDGFCQRFNYVIAPPRTDTDMFDHFLYFAGEGIEEWQAELRELWYALCAQKGALETYTMNDGVLPYLEGWWRGLRGKWGNAALPGSFVRRTGFSILSYMVVLHFLIGKSRRPIDLETAELATKYAEFHLESTLVMIREYDRGERPHVQTVAAKREKLLQEGSETVKVRDIQRRLSKKQSQELSKERIAEILSVLDRLESEPGLFQEVVSEDNGLDAARRAKIEFLKRRAAPVLERWGKRERWRNQKRLTRLLSAYRSHLQGDAEFDLQRMKNASNVVSIGERHVTDREAS